MKTFLCKTLFFSALSISFTAGYAQKKSDVTPNILAASPYKIDGKITDWGDTLKSYNSGSKIYYAIANDDKTLYLAIKCNDSPTITKIMAGGISFTVNTEGKKKDGPTVKYPIIDRSAMRSGMQQRSQGGGSGESRGNADPAAQHAARVEMAKKALSAAKEINVEGIKAIPDGNISIYNEFGIKAAATITESNAYVYELAIPLSVLNINDPGKELALQIKTNGLEMPQTSGGFGGPGGGGSFGGGGGSYGGGNYGGSGGGYSRSGIDFSTLFQPTDFWIKASLATK